MLHSVRIRSRMNIRNVNTDTWILWYQLSSIRAKYIKSQLSLNMFLSQPWRVGLTGLGITLNAFTVIVHTKYGFDTALPQLASHKKPLYNIIGVCFIHLMLLPVMSSILQLKWLQFGLDSPYDRPLLACYVLGHFAFGCWYYALGARAPLLSTVVSPLTTLLCLL
ncbi:uncharacterized protein VTP21DRAFT_7782 [Calcarisporiella thermophila]|uniref:uncharacterized protein n=1 Tax=Calcarisporiella thermophila TaxID=911321 RepID=UPI003743E9AF